MKILISDSRKIQQLQEQFNTAYPFLKLEFFSRPHKMGHGSAPKLMKGADRTIGPCRTINKKGNLNISPDMTVAEIEQKFRENYGLNVQIFRKSGKVWLETTVTDGWTLEQQNSQGEALSKLVYTRNDGRSAEG